MLILSTFFFEIREYFIKTDIVYTYFKHNPHKPDTPHKSDNLDKLDKLHQPDKLDKPYIIRHNYDTSLEVPPPSTKETSLSNVMKYTTCFEQFALRTFGVTFKL
jgi:lysyl-tRNA synthetase class I